MSRLVVLLVAGFASSALASEFEHLHVLTPDPFEIRPAEVTHPISEMSLQWPMLMRDYLWHTGDEAFVGKVVDERFEWLLTQLLDQENESGLLPSMENVWHEEAQWLSGAVITNVFYVHSLQTATALLDDLGRNSALVRIRAGAAKAAFRKHLAPALLKPDARVEEVAAAIVFGLLDPAKVAGFSARAVQAFDGMFAPMRPLLIEACFKSGDFESATTLLEAELANSRGEGDRCGDPSHGVLRGEHWCNPMQPGAEYLMAQYVYGIAPAAPGWSAVRYSPRSIGPPEAFSIGVPGGRIGLRAEHGTTRVISVPVHCEVRLAPQQGMNVMVKNMLSHTSDMLTPAQGKVLREAGWEDRVGTGRGIWISAKEQVLRVVQGDAVLYQAQCATALAGLGSEMNSLKTPTGWHEIKTKIGHDAPWGQVFRARRPTREVWKPGDDVIEDMVLTRVLLLDGLEPGHNKGGRVDSFDRHIYIHGTNGEDKIGVPSSHGCIRMLNDDVIEFFNRTDEGTAVLITVE